jgi:hypothetical protein
MKQQEFNKYLERDNNRCVHCGRQGDDLVPQHRLNRGFGGKNSKANQVANCLVFCSVANGLIESDPDLQQEAYLYGWKLASWQDPLTEPVYYKFSGEWFILDNSYGRSFYKNENSA